MGLINDIMDDLDSRSPVLFVGSAVLDFKKWYDGPIRVVRSNDDVRELVSYYSNMSSLGKCLVIDDLSFLTSTGISLLLKLVEDSKFNIVLLSLFDKVSSVMLSRVKTVVKYSRDKIESDFMPVGSGYSKVRDSLSEDSHIYDKYRYIARYSPMVYYINSKLNGYRNKDKIMELLS